MRRPSRSVLVVLCACALPLAHARAQPPLERVVSDPPRLAPAGPALRAVAGAAPTAAAGEVAFDLSIAYTQGRIWNPAEGRYDAVHLRSYQGTGVDPQAPYVSPTIEVSPGTTVRITLHNKLPADPSCTDPAHEVNRPHCFNGTNLHSHGLWVSPAGNGDNVLLSINPGVTFQYEYNLPADHPSGTFWYHTHRHGSTALQVSSGMAGALIVRGNRAPTPQSHGDIDTLLKSTRNVSFGERILVMQQIQYACRDGEQKIKVNTDGSYRCDPGDTGGIEGYDQFGPGSWPASGRHTAINGQVLATFDGAQAGRIERWRVIHGGVRDTINLEFRRLAPNAPSPQRLSAPQQDAFVHDSCSGAPLTQYLVAADGLTMSSVHKSAQTVFQPGYRWDLLMVFPQEGIYCVIDADAPASASVNQAPPSRRLLGLVHVAKGHPVTSDVTAWLATQLEAAAAANMPAPVRAQVVADLRDGMKLTSFVPHPDVKDDEVTGQQLLTFKIVVPKDDPAIFEVNGKPYDPARMDRVLRLGGVDEWVLRSDFVSHPFHIHVNPFQVVRILDPTGRDVSVAGAVDDAGGTPDVQYPGLKGVWKDTLWVKNVAPPNTPPEPGQYTIVVRTRYERYIGAYVLHCHILDHEDQGMMQNVVVALPDGQGGVAQEHH
jgi:FtsP/CotA-like multicopper oxidase with cupredoxin domain